MTAVQDGDRAELARLVSPRMDARAEMDAKVRAIGGKRWNSISVTWNRDEFPSVAVASISAVDPAGRPVADTVVLAKSGDSWYVGLGSAPVAGTPADIREPSRAPGE